MPGVTRPLCDLCDLCGFILLFPLWEEVACAAGRRWGLSEPALPPKPRLAPRAERDPTSVRRPPDTSSHRGRRTVSSPGAARLGAGGVGDVVRRQDRVVGVGQVAPAAGPGRAAGHGRGERRAGGGPSGPAATGGAAGG